MGRLRYAGKRGFSLVEVVITVGILAAGIVVVVQAIAAAGRAATTAVEVSQASMRLRDHLGELAYKARQGALLEGTFRAGGEGVAQQDVVSLEEGTGLYRVDASQQWSRGKDEGTVQASTLLVGP